MATPLSDKAVDLLSAALRHMQDAECLATPHGHESQPPHEDPRSSPDQAFHLAGFAAECVRKATLGTRHFDKAIGHRFGPFEESVLECALALDPAAHRYRVSDLGALYPSLTTWREDCRYERTGQRGDAEVQPLLREARTLVDRIFLALFADGRLPDAVSL